MNTAMHRLVVYILASDRHGTLYVGVTNDIQRRLQQHREGMNAGFTKKYRVHRLIYFEIHESPSDPIRREKHIKKWRRDWKANLIERDNPNWDDLALSLTF